MRTRFGLTVLLVGLCMSMGCKVSSMHNTEREVSWGMSVKLSHQTTQGPDVVAWDMGEVPSIAEAVFGPPEPDPEDPATD